jgi:hypothetical protein
MGHRPLSIQMGGRVMGTPSVSVVVPMYNKEKFSQRTLNSIQRQVLTDYEVLVVDDGSTDSSAVAVEPLLTDKRFRLIRQQNVGEGGARNRGLREAAGSIVAFLDADDEWLPDHLECIVNLAALFPTAGFYATGYRSIYRNFSVLRTINRRSPCLIQDYYRFVSSGAAIQTSSVAVRRDIVLPDVLFNHRELGSDVEFFLRIAAITPLAYDPHISSIYHCGIQGGIMAGAGWRGDAPLTARYMAQCLVKNQIPLSLISSAQMYLRKILVGHALGGLSLGRKAEALASLTLSSSLDETEKRKLDHVRSLLRWIPQSVSSATIRLFRSRWGLALRSLSASRDGASGQARAHSKIVWQPHVSGRGN